MSGRRQAKKARIERDLIDAAAAAFVERGFAQATLDDIAAASGLTKGAVYSNFDSKADLALAVLNDKVSQPLLGLLDLLGDAEKPGERFRKGASALNETLATMKPWFMLDLELTLQATRDPRLLNKLRQRDRSLYAAASRAISHRARKDQKESFGDPADVADMAELVMALSVVADGVAMAKLKDEEAVSEALLHRIVVGILATFSDDS